MQKTKFFFLVFILSLFSIKIASAATIKTDDAAHFLSISDIHFDPFTACNNVIPCKLIEALRAAPSNQWVSILAEGDKAPPVYKQDTNYTLLESALAAAKQTAKEQQARFVLALGDFIGHNFRKNYVQYTSDESQEGYQAFVKKTLEFLTSELQKTFPTLDVYSVIGNNDSYEEDYVSESQQGPFYTDMAALWSSLIKNQANKYAMQKAFQMQGYYAVDVGNLHIIALNSSLFSAKASGGQPDDARKELDWFHNELVAAANKKQSVLILTHIPIGIDTFASLKTNPFKPVDYWKPEFTQRFQSELQAYSFEILGVMSGHAHTDWFQILTTDSPKELPVSYTPAISPQFGNNPGFKIFSYNNNALVDFTTYFYSLDNDKAWHVEYNFNEVYQPGCHDCQLVNGMNQLKPTGELAELYKKYFALGPDSQPITKGKWIPYYWCQIRAISATDYMKCVDQK